MYALLPNSSGQCTMCPDPSKNAKKRRDEETVGGRVPILPTDVIGGRGRFNFQQQPGNDLFDNLIGHYAPLHRSGGGSMAMSKIHIAVMAQLPAGCRFMTEYDRETNSAIQLTPGAARIKIGQAIRYRNSPKHRRRISLASSCKSGNSDDTLAKPSAHKNNEAHTFEKREAPSLASKGGFATPRLSSEEGFGGSVTCSGFAPEMPLSSDRMGTTELSGGGMDSYLSAQCTTLDPLSQPSVVSRCTAYDFIAYIVLTLSNLLPDAIQ